jgi:hypothetical protein
MRLLEREMPPDPEIERELEALDRALAGEPVEPDLEHLAQLARELRSERPQPTAEAEGRLDELAAGGFPPRLSDRLGRASRRLGEASARLRLKPARRLIPAAVAAVVFVTAVGVGISESGVLNGSQNGSPPQPVRGQGTASRNAPSQITRAAKAPMLSPAARSGAADRFTQHLPPTRATRTQRLALGGLGHRKIARNVYLQLSTAPSDFRHAADGVLAVVRAHRGFVVRSHVSGGDPAVKGARRGRASFDLRIPSGELSAAMGDLSALGHVVSRTDGTIDVTKRFASARKRIDALNAARDRLLRRLGRAVTVPEQQSIKARLRIVEARLASAHGDLARAQQRVHLVPVSVQITANGKQAPGGAWTIADAFHDAGRVLTVTAGAALVAGAALLPLALLAGLGAAGWRGWVRRQRSRALDAPAG